MRKLLTGNEAIARGAYESGITVATAYPGTPSTEILETIGNYDEIKAQWSPNEKVALEVGIGASIAGARVLVAMKHVGVNVAADPLFTLAYTGVGGGLVLVSADDPGMHSSQNEQDNRYYALVNRMPMLEPTDSQEAKDFIGIAMELSERFDTPVLLRVTTRICHSQSLVELKNRTEKELVPYVKQPQKYVMLPAFGRMRRIKVEERINELKKYAEECSLNAIEWGNKNIGIITSGISYQYAKEAIPNASFLKLGFTNPLPENMIRKFAEEVDKLYVIEELSPFIEDQLKAWGIQVIGKEIFSGIGELSVNLIKEKILGTVNNFQTNNNQAVPIRPPVLCPGCPHRGVFYTFKKLGLIVSGDIGCYTLGALEPLSSMDTTICMGASIGVALGMEKANPNIAQKLVAVIGDSTFFHSGITGLIDVVYNQTNTTTVILDNRTTAMTGHQHNPGTGKTLQGSDTTVIDLEQLVKAIGIKRVVVVDPLNLEQLEQAIKSELSANEPSVIITKKPCALLPSEQNKQERYTASDACIGCKKCIDLACPAIRTLSNGKVEVNQTLCNGCGVCAQVCPVGALMEVK